MIWLCIFSQRVKKKIGQIIAVMDEKNPFFDEDLLQNHIPAFLD